MSEPSDREKLDLGRIFREELRFTLRTFFAPIRGAARAMRERWDEIAAESRKRPARDDDGR